MEEVILKLKDEMELTWRGTGNRVPRGRTASAKALRQKRIWHILGVGNSSTGNGRTVAKEGFRETGTPLGHVSHGCYPKLNRKSQKAFKQK